MIQRCLARIALSISARVMRLGAVTRRPLSSIMKPIERRVERRSSNSRLWGPSWMRRSGGASGARGGVGRVTLGGAGGALNKGWVGAGLAAGSMAAKKS
jgi:hypothetical protein